MTNKWSNGLSWMFLSHHIPMQASNIWKRIGEAWTSMLDYVTTLSPINKKTTNTQHTTLMESYNQKSWIWVLK